MRGLGRIFRRGRIWWIAYSHDGKERRESTRSATRTAAVDLLKARVSELRAGTFHAGHGKIRFDELLDLLERDYRIHARKSQRELSYKLRLLRERFRGLLASEMTTARIERFKDERLEEVKPATVNIELAHIQKAFSLGVRQGLIRHAPVVDRLQVRNRRTGFLEPAEFADLLGHLPDDGLRDFARWAYLTGSRRGEIRDLTWAEVHECDVRIPDTKNSEERIIPLVDELAEIIDCRRRNAEYDGALIRWVFHRHGRPVRHFRKTWKKATAAINRPDMVFHSLRRSFCRNARRAGLSESEIMLLGGWRTPETFRRYNIISESDLREASRRAQRGARREA